MKHHDHGFAPELIPGPLNRGPDQLALGFISNGVTTPGWDSASERHVATTVTQGVVKPSSSGSEQPDAPAASSRGDGMIHEPRRMSCSKTMHLQQGLPAPVPTRNNSRRISARLSSRRIRQLNRLATSNGRDMSSLVADAVEAVYGNGADFVRLRSNVRGLARLMSILVLLDNSILEIGEALLATERDSMSEELTRHVALARLDSIHHALGRIARTAAAWRKQDVATAAAGEISQKEPQ